MLMVSKESSIGAKDAIASGLAKSICGASALLPESFALSEMGQQAIESMGGQKG